MILEALVRHYGRLTEEEESGIARYGFSLQKVGFAIVLNADGTLHAIEPLTDDTSGKPRPVEMVLPGQSKPSGSGINPCFLWDNGTYLLGFVPEGRDLAWASSRFEGFRDRHLTLRDMVDDDAFTAVCTFLGGWKPPSLPDRTDIEPLTRPGFGVFRLRGAAEYVHDRPAVRRYWLSEIGDAMGTDQASTNVSGGMCLVTGQRGSLARLHEPKIKGVSGGQSSGATLVSFNLGAFDSYGREQGYNAPVRESAAFQYTTALNHLLADKEHRVQLGDTTCVFWTQTPSDAPGNAPDALAEAMGFWSGGKQSDEDREKEKQSALRDFLNRFRKAKTAPGAAALEDAHVPFYVLGLSPNAARISVRFWLRSTVAEMAARLERHVDATEMCGARDDHPSPTLRQLLRETGREAKDIPPQLAGDMARAMLADTPYPRTFAVAILRRIVADCVINHPRAAGLKGWLVRNHEMEVTVSLDSARTDAPYLLGRLFATYEKVQKDALGDKLNRTIRDSYLSAASASPASVFPRLYRLSQHHLSNLRRDKPGLAVVRERLIGEICDDLDNFPTRLPLEAQGLFAIGYYHQIQDFYTRREDVAASGDNDHA